MNVTITYKNGKSETLADVAEITKRPDGDTVIIMESGAFSVIPAEYNAEIVITQ